MKRERGAGFRKVFELGFELGTLVAQWHYVSAMPKDYPHRLSFYVLIALRSESLHAQLSNTSLFCTCNLAGLTVNEKKE